MNTFDPKAYLPDGVMALIANSRVERPFLASETAVARTRRSQLTTNGRLSLIAADHPARMATAAGNDALAMADRQGLLARIVRVLAHDAADGILATMDILEDLLILDALRQERGAPSFLNEKVLLASLNRGGLAGSAWELNDSMTGPTPDACARWNLDGAKALLRVCPTDPGSLRTIEACAQASRELEAHGLPFFLEPLPAMTTASGIHIVREAGPLAQLVGVAAALGNSAQGLWHKLPWCEDFDVVAGASSLPILLLGGPVLDDPGPLLTQIRDGLDAGPNVRGVLLGRNVLYPSAHDPLALAGAVQRLVHQNCTVGDAEAFASAEAHDHDALTRWFEETP
jgi:DhnA family fructose-bisphosphate aldolase class Ia